MLDEDEDEDEHDDGELLLVTVTVEADDSQEGSAGGINETSSDWLVGEIKGVREGHGVRTAEADSVSSKRQPACSASARRRTSLLYLVLRVSFSLSMACHRMRAEMLLCDVPFKRKKPSDNFTVASMVEGRRRPVTSARASDLRKN